LAGKSPHNRKDRQRAEQRGRLAERVCVLHLFVTGWRILDHRARTAAGELDLVARRGSVLAFIEVKQRPDFSRGFEAVSGRQKHRLIRAAALWRGAHPELSTLSVRFDVMVVQPWTVPRRMPAAFVAETPVNQNLL